jgi:E3 ubiquitin-protein ligase ZSWIM2
MSRQAAYRIKPSAQFAGRLEEAKSTRFFIVSNPGPTSFVLKGDGGIGEGPARAGKKFKVSIGECQACSCNPRGGAGGEELCVHLLFVMVKVLRVPDSNPVLWQWSLVGSEVDSLLRGNAGPSRAERRRQEALQNHRSAHGTLAAAEAGAKPRRNLEVEDVCPICQDDMVGQGPSKVTFCRYAIHLVYLYLSTTLYHTPTHPVQHLHLHVAVYPYTPTPSSQQHRAHPSVLHLRDPTRSPLRLLRATGPPALTTCTATAASRMPTITAAAVLWRALSAGRTGAPSATGTRSGTRRRSGRRP